MEPNPLSSTLAVNPTFRRIAASVTTSALRQTGEIAYFCEKNRCFTPNLAARYLDGALAPMLAIGGRLIRIGTLVLARP